MILFLTVEDKIILFGLIANQIIVKQSLRIGEYNELILQIRLNLEVEFLN